MRTLALIASCRRPVRRPFLNHPQQFGLMFQGDVVHVVQVNGAAFGQLEPALARLVGSGKRTGLVAVQLAFDQRRREQIAAT